MPKYMSHPFMTSHYDKQKRRNKSFPLDPNDPRHGKATTYYNLECRCSKCREAMNENRKRWPKNRGAIRASYKELREAGFSADEARQRRYWKDPWK